MVYDLGLKYWVDTHLKHTFLKIELYDMHKFKYMQWKNGKC